MKKLAIITTHPIQYYAPVFKMLQQRQQITIKVFYTWGENAAIKYDPGFNKTIEWDIPLFDGYSYEWLENTSADPGSHHFKGIINPHLTKEIKKWQPDALLVYGWGYDSHLKALRYFKNKVPVLFRGDSTLLDEKGGLKAFFKAVFLRWVYSHVDHAFYVGTNNKEYFRKYGLKDKQLTFAPHAIDNDRFSNQNELEAATLREGLGIKDNEIVILFAGKLEEKKDPLLLLEAFLTIKRAGAHLVFVGEGPLESQLIAKAKNKTGVHFIGFQNQSQMPAAYQACDLFCIPSLGPGETWGLAINEAMACGKPIIASNKVGAAVDLVKPENGAIFAAGDLTDLIYTLRRFLAYSKNELVAMGQQSKEIIKDSSFENQVKAIERIVKNEQAAG